MTRRVLREWQQEAIDAVRAEWAAGRNRTAVVAATGLGKSSVIAALAVAEAEAGGTALLLGHRDMLLDQMRDTCRLFNPEIAVGRIQAGTDQRGFPITVAMAPTLGRAARRARMRRPSLVIVDECHRAANDTYRAILEWAGSYEGTRTLGVTATLTRGDKRPLGTVWQSVALTRDIAWGVEQGLLVKPRGRVVVADHMDLGKARTSRGDYVDADLGEMVSQSTVEIVRAWREHAAERLTVAFAPTVDSAQQLADEFNNHGVKAEVVTAQTSGVERSGMYRRLHEGVTRVLVNVFVLVEGWDEPRVECVLMARPTKLPGVYTQAVGRGLRPSPDTGKIDCLVLDVCGSSRRQKLTTLIDLAVPDIDYDRTDQSEDEEPAEPREPGPGRDPDGGRRRLLGPARYEDLDLIPDVRATYRWLRTHAGVPFLLGSNMWARDRAAILWPDTGRTGSRTWTPGHVAVRGPQDAVLIDPGAVHTFESARQAAQVWAGPSPRRRPGPVDAFVLGKARALGVAAPERLDRAALLDAIEVARVSRAVDR